MRIIGGIYKGIPLFSPKDGNITRPTTDRVRENLFNILENLQVSEAIYKWQNQVVLDAFCGTGALGIEALSRGASTALFIDNNTQAVDICKKNIEYCKIPSRIANIKLQNLPITKEGSNIHSQYSMIFLDPPYGKNLGIDTLLSLKKYNLLDKNMICILETDKKQPETIPNDFKIIDERLYGRVRLQLLTLAI